MVYACKGSEVVPASTTFDGRLCGHATLGSAHALRSHPQLLASQDPTLVFNTLSGALTVDISSPDKLLMDFPADAIVELPGTLSLAKVSAAIDVSRQDIANVTVSEQNGYIVIEVTEFVDIESLNVDSAALVHPNFPTFLNQAQLFPGNLAQTVTNFKSGILFCRVFATAAGIPEDPVTGSMYTVLGPYWKAKTGNSTFRARQCSKRGGDVQVEVKDNGRVIVGGQAVNVMEGDLFY